MKIKTLYRYVQDNMVIDSPVLPEGVDEVTERYRLVADEGYLLSMDGQSGYVVIDIDKEQISLWQEVEETSIISEETEEE